MNPTRTGKIARLPKSVRDELGHRLENGEPGNQLVEWLNAHPEVQKVLQDHFGGRAINEPNLTEWKQGGHVEWLRIQELRDVVQHVQERADALLDATQGEPISERFARVIALEFSRTADDLLAQETDPQKRFERLCQVHREFSRLRRDEQMIARLRIKTRQSDREAILAGREDKRLADEQRRKELLARLEAGRQIDPLSCKLYQERKKIAREGWSYEDECAAAYTLEVQNDLPIGTFGYHNPLLPIPPDPDDQIKWEADSDTGEPKDNKLEGPSQN
jgi:hypothetical protein